MRSLFYGWDERIRTFAWWIQSPQPYRLATSQFGLLLYSTLFHKKVNQNFQNFIRFPSPAITKFSLLILHFMCVPLCRFFSYFVRIQIEWSHWMIARAVPHFIWLNLTGENPCFTFCTEIPDQIQTGMMFIQNCCQRILRKESCLEIEKRFIFQFRSSHNPRSVSHAENSTEKCAKKRRFLER